MGTNGTQRESIGEGGHSLMFDPHVTGRPLLPIPCYRQAFVFKRFNVKVMYY